MCRSVLRAFLAVLAVAAIAPAALAQAPAQPPAAPASEPPPPPWSGSAGLGFSMDRGNTDTTDFHLTFDAKSDPTQDGVWKFQGLYERDAAAGKLAANHLIFDARYEQAITPRVYGYGALGFLKDEFKLIDYLWAPSAGIGYRVVKTEQTMFNVDGGLGVRFEKNPDVDLRTDFALMAGDKFEHKLSKTASITQGFTAIWKANDFGDALYTFSGGVAAALTTRTQIKVQFLDAYDTLPPSPDVKKNDVALLTSLVFKF